jgi:lipopolysaccharide transport system ATP-binding protein
MTKAIQVQGLGKRYNIRPYQDRSLRATLQQVLKFKSSKKVPFWALEDVNFSVNEGEVFGIIGTNGSGKSTLLKILSKIVIPTTGRVELVGKINSLLEVGTGFHPELTGRQNVYLNGSILGLKKHEVKSRFDEIVDFSEVETFLDTPVKHYSSGMFVRLAFAVAAHLDPDILVVDEVLSVGDLAFQQKCIKKMEEEVLQGRTVLFVSHNMDIVQKLCEKVMLLHKGRMVEIGTPEPVIKHFLHRIKTQEPDPMQSAVQRRGTGVIRIREIEILNEEGTPTRVFVTGETITFMLKYTSQQNNVRQVDFRITLKHINSESTITLQSGLQYQPDVEFPDCGKAICTVERLPLNVGDYTIDLEVLQDRILADLLPDLTSIEVLPGPFYATGNLPGGQFPLLVDFQWQITD